MRALQSTAILDELRGRMEAAPALHALLLPLPLSAKRNVPLSRMSLRELRTFVAASLPTLPLCRSFIPLMMKAELAFTGRRQIGWGNAALLPAWWPEDMRFANIRADTRDKEAQVIVHQTCSPGADFYGTPAVARAIC